MNERNFTLTLTEQDVNILIAGLGKLPLEASLMVWQKVKQQAEEQMRQPTVDAEPAGLTAP